MKGSFKSTLLLTAVLAGLIGWYVLYEQKYRPQSEEKEEKTKQLVTLEKDQIQEVEITRIKNAPKEEEGATAHNDPNFKPEFETIKLKKSGTDWLITEPVSYPGDNSQISSMVSTLATTKQERVVEEKPKDLAAYGLKDPRVKVIARKDSGNPPQEVWIGLNTPVGSSAYAKVAGQEPVFKVSRALKNSFEKKPNDLRNRNIITTPRTEVTELEIQTNKENVVLKKDDKDNWTLARENFPADAQEAGKTFSAVIEARAKEFISEKAEKLSTYGLDKPAAKATLFLKDQNKITLLVGKVKDKFYASRTDKPQVFEVEKTLLERLEKPGSDYRSLTLASFNRYDVKHIKIVVPGAPEIELVKGDTGTWTLPSEVTAKVNANEVDSLLTALQDAKISRYGKAPKDKTGVKTPKLTIHLFEKSDKGETEKVVLKFDAVKGKEVLGERADLTVPFYLKSEDFAKFNNLNKQRFLQPEAKPSEKEPKKS